MTPEKRLRVARVVGELRRRQKSFEHLAAASQVYADQAPTPLAREGEMAKRGEYLEHAEDYATAVAALEGTL